jgi:hypothetical protein
LLGAVETLPWFFMSQARSTTAQTLGATLERDRLEYRVSRVSVAISALRQLAGDPRHQAGPPPRHIRHAIADFEAQIASMNARLRDLDDDFGAAEGRPR